MKAGFDGACPRMRCMCCPRVVCQWAWAPFVDPEVFEMFKARAATLLSLQVRLPGDDRITKPKHRDNDVSNRPSTYLSPQEKHNGRSRACQSNGVSNVPSTFLSTSRSTVVEETWRTNALLISERRACGNTYCVYPEDR